MEELREEMVVVWFKRDLRLIDHAPILNAQKENLPILFIYCFEPSIIPSMFFPLKFNEIKIFNFITL
jgi:deoxyribodipyrimidine photolyase